MAINVPTSKTLPSGDLARCKTHEADDTWPTMIEIVAYWSEDGTRRGKRRSMEISADQFFGRNGHNAPMSAEALMAMINRLRKS